MTIPTPEQLHHLADRARRGVLLPDEGALLADGVAALVERLEDQATADEVAERSAQAISAMGADIRSARAERDRYRLAWKSARARVKQAKRAQDGELRHANIMWSHALRDLDRYRKSWQSARHRAAMYLQSNQKFAASLDNGHAVQVHAERVARSAASSAAVALTHQLAAEQSAVRAIHTRVLRMEALVCACCGHAWPCSTIQALDEQQPTTTEAAPFGDRHGPTPDEVRAGLAGLFTTIGPPVSCPHCGPDAAPIPSTHWTKHLIRHHPEQPTA